MNEAVARAARRRNAGAAGDAAAQPSPQWRPLQLAFILLNLAGLVDKAHTDCEIVDLLFFPTGGGKTVAYLGLAACLRDRPAPAVQLGCARRRRLRRHALHITSVDIGPPSARSRGRLRARADAQRGRICPRRAAAARGLADRDWALGRLRRFAKPTRRSGRHRGRHGRHSGSAFRGSGRQGAGADQKPARGAAHRSAVSLFSACRIRVAPRNLEIRCANHSCDFAGNRRCRC